MSVGQGVSVYCGRDFRGMEPQRSHSCIKTFMAVKEYVGLRFVQRRFYNPHHHPEMPRTLQSLDRRVRHGEEQS